MAYLLPQDRGAPARLLNLGAGGLPAIERFVQELQRFKGSTRELPLVRAKALELVRGARPNDEVAEVMRVWRYVRDRVRYVKDVRDVDTLQTPTATLSVMQGDCDDKSLLLAAMLEAIGYATRFVVVATVPQGTYNHVYVEAFIGRVGRWVPLESSVPGFPFGLAVRSYEPPRRFA